MSTVRGICYFAGMLFIIGRMSFISSIYDHYWERKKLLKNPPIFPVTSWQETDGLSSIEKIYFAQIQNKKKVLDVGAGDLRMKNKFLSAGFRGEFHTQDIGTEYSYTYRTLQDVRGKYEAILCLDVIEHMSLVEGLELLQTLLELLDEKGVLIVQTPNGRCIRHPTGWDMTHVQCYNLADIWAWFTVKGYIVEGWRVVFLRRKETLLQKFYTLVGRFVITRLLGADYADNIALMVTKKN